MSDLLAATGWVGEHPRTGADVAHLLLYPATDLDTDTGGKIASLAALWALTDATSTGMETSELRVSLDPAVVLLPGHAAVQLPPLNTDWLAAAKAQRFVVASLTNTPLAAPGVAEIEDLIAQLAPGRMWVGLAPTRAHPDGEGSGAEMRNR